MPTIKNKALAAEARTCDRCGTLLPKAEVTPRRTCFAVFDTEGDPEPKQSFAEGIGYFCARCHVVMNEWEEAAEEDE